MSRWWERVEQLDLFAQASGAPCMWHPDREATHRVVIAVDLLATRWWDGGRRLGCACCGATRVALFVVGAGQCDDCVARQAGALLNPGTVKHYIPIGGSL